VVCNFTMRAGSIICLSICDEQVIQPGHSALEDVVRAQSSGHLGNRVRSLKRHQRQETTHFRALRVALQPQHGIPDAGGQPAHALQVPEFLRGEKLQKIFPAEEFRYLERVRRLPASIRNARLRLQGYMKGAKMRRFLTLMSFQAAYTIAEVATALGPDYVFKGRMAGVNYLLVVNRKTNS
jgi:hypothetical protein